MLFVLLHQSKYCSFARNSKDGNPSSKLAAFPFIEIISYKYFHIKSFALLCIAYSRTAKTIYIPQTSFVFHCTNIHELQVHFAPVTHSNYMPGSFERNGMKQYSYAWR